MTGRGAVLLLLTLCAARPALSAERLVPHPQVSAPLVYRQSASGETQVRLQSLIYPWISEWVPIRELGLVNPKAKQTLRGVHLASIANREGRLGLPNRRFYSRPRIACAAFVSWCLRQAGWRWTSNSARGLYNLLRKHGGKLVASNVSTRYTPYFVYFKAGDVLAFSRGGRIRHVEVYIGAGMTVGTSSSALHVGIRRVGNRGYLRMNVIRI